MKDIIKLLEKVHDPYVLGYLMIVGVGCTLVGLYAYISTTFLSKEWPQGTIIGFFGMGVLLLVLWLYAKFVVRRN